LRVAPPVAGVIEVYWSPASECAWTTCSGVERTPELIGNTLAAGRVVAF